jgi:hypothetical protein
MVKRLKLYKLGIILALALFAFCKNPLEEEKKKEPVRDVYYTQAPIGRHIYFWDGKDENGTFVSPGKYIIVMEVKHWQDQQTVIALAAGKPGANDDWDLYFNEFYSDYELLVPEPDPFKVQEGVNIGFLVGNPEETAASVKLSIYKD